MASFLEELMNPTMRGELPWMNNDVAMPPPPPPEERDRPKRPPAGYLAGLLEEPDSRTYGIDRYGAGSRPTEIDYSQGFPAPYLGDKSRPGPFGDDKDLARGAMDRDLADYRKTSPPPVPMMPGAGTPVGMLGLTGGPGPGTMPPGVGGNPVPPQMAAPLPPAQDVAPMKVASVPDQPAPPVAPPGATDFSAQGRPGAPSGAPRAAEPSFGELLSNGLDRNSSTLLALGAGFAGAPSFGTGMSRGFGNAIQGGQIDYQRNQQQAGITSTFRALVDAGVPPRLAMSAAQNPEILKQIAPDYLATRKSEIKTIKSKDFLGNETEKLVSINPYTHEVNELGGQGGGKGGQPTIPGEISVTPQMMQAMQMPEMYDPSSGKDEKFLAALDPMTRSVVQAADRGDTGVSSRNLQKIQPLVTRYNPGWSIGDYQQKQKFRTEMGSATPSSWGGQTQLVGTALGHLGEVADAAAALGNYNGLGSSDLAHASNAVLNRTTGNAAKVNKLNETASRFSGEVGKLYAGSQGGGVHEREMTAGRFGGNRSSEELIAGLEASRDLIHSKIDSLQAQAEKNLGPGAAAGKIDILGDKGRESLKRIDAAIAKLRGNQPTEASSQAKVQRSPTLGIPWRVVE